MKVYPDTTTPSLNMTEELENKLKSIRRRKKFEAYDYLFKKGELLNRYMDSFSLSTCIVAVSGGVDSSVVLGIVQYAAGLRDSPIKHIVPVLLPAVHCRGVTDQESATAQGIEVCKSFDVDGKIIDLSSVGNILKKEIDSSIDIVGDNWSEGQLIPYLRTPSLYYVSSLYTQKGFPAIICGTTNKDEGAYLGYVGKASDGMVDIQLISDLHKSEVYKLAEELNIPDSILKVEPKGDMYDKRTDVEVFGASYDFVELYLTFLSYNRGQKLKFLSSLDQPSTKIFNHFSKNLEDLHHYNEHKYFGRSPAVHLDIFKNKVPGEWGVPTESVKWFISGRS